MYAELDGDTDNFPMKAIEYYEKTTGKSIEQLRIERGYTWYTYAIKKNYYWKDER